MLTPIVTQLPKSQVELKFSITPDEAKPYLDQAVTDISTHRPIAGFRPGKAGYDDVKRAFGEMAIWENALERLVRAVFVKAVLQEQIETVGSPEIAVQKLAPGSDIEFTTVVNTMPHVTNLTDYTKIKVDFKRRLVTETDVEKTIDDLRKMRRNEIATDQAATMDDMILVNLNIRDGQVPIEGGQSTNYRVYLNEQSYIPGFAEKVVGMKKNEKREFDLAFPADHYNKALAGKTVTFDVEVIDVFRLEIPIADEQFAKSAGVENMEKLRELLQNNLQQEADQKTDEAAEIELLEKMIKESKFSEVPELLVNEEVRRMMIEMEQSIENQGGNMKDYLSSIKKSESDLKLDLITRALERIKTAVIIKEIGKKENISVTDDEVDTEIDLILSGLKPNDTETRERVTTPEYRDYVAVQIRNQKIIKFLKQTNIKK
ncbi:trigger factor [Candidatus Uhrbacteria bacterium]|nr:trigger factor [Candidatus Uhrbacteria bacterium]